MTALPKVSTLPTLKTLTTPATPATPATPGTLARPGSHRGVTLVRVKESLWRVTDTSGAVLGHIERRTDVDGERFTARRLIAAVRSMELGVFWRIDDAADCFR